MLDKSVVTEDGEVIEARPDVPFRSITDLKGYNDDEVNTLPSLVDDSEYEPLESIIARCQRGELIGVRDTGYFEYSGDFNDDAVLDQEFYEQDLTAVDDAAELMAQRVSSLSVEASASSSVPAEDTQSEVESPPERDVVIHKVDRPGEQKR